MRMKAFQSLRSGTSPSGICPRVFDWFATSGLDHYLSNYIVLSMCRPSIVVVRVRREVIRIAVTRRGIRVVQITTENDIGAK